MMKYIRYTPEYFNKAKDLIHRSICELNNADYPPEMIKIMKEWQSEESLSEKFSTGYYVIALHENEVIGIGGLIRNTINTMFTHPDFTKQGIGSNILKILEQAAENNNVKILYLSSTLSAKKFYVQNGFKIIRRAVHKLNNVDFEVYEMQKELA